MRVGRPLGHWGRGAEDAQLSQQKSPCNSDTACALEGLLSSGFSAYIMHISRYKYKNEMKPYFFYYGKTSQWKQLEHPSVSRTFFVNICGAAVVRAAERRSSAPCAVAAALSSVCRVPGWPALR